MPDSPLPPEAITALKAGHKIEAIKHVRQARGIGLKEAKEAVEAYVAGLPSAVRDPSGPVMRESGGKPWWAFILIALGILVYALIERG